VALEVDVIWTVGSVATKAAKEATRTIPVVMVSADAVGAGLVASLARPGGNLTGLTLIANEIVGKRLDLSKQLDPNIKRLIALAHGPGSANTPIVAEWLRHTQSAASSLRLAFSFVELPTADPKQWDDEFGLLAAAPGAALSVMESPFFLEHSELIARLALKHRLPTVFAFKQHVKSVACCPPA
jgi:putative ABC transport system substrate-binding protein